MRLRSLWLATVCSLAAAGASAALLDDFGAELSFDDNITAGDFGRDVKSDAALAVFGSGGPRWQLGDHDSLSLDAEFEARAQRRYDGLDNAAAGLALAWHHKLGLGPYVPQLGLRAGATRRDYRHALRDRWHYSVEAEASKRLDERVGLRASIGAERHVPDRRAPRAVPFLSGNVFDLTNRWIGATVDFAWRPRYVLSAGYTHNRGDVVSTTLRNRTVFLASDAITADPVFGPDRFAYRLQARTHVLRLGVSREIGRQGSLSLGYEYRDSRGDGGVAYQSNIVRATYLYGF